MRFLFLILFLVFVPFTAQAGSCAGAGNLSAACTAAEVLQGFQNGDPICVLRVDNLARICGDQGMLYGPGHPRADAQGCIPDLDVADSGNVGIGTTNPISKLHVTGDAFLAADLPTIRLKDIGATPNNNLFMIHNSRGNLHMGSATDNWGWKDNGEFNAGDLVITNNGRVGIGTQYPGASLDLTKNWNEVTLQLIKNNISGSNAMMGLQLLGNVNGHGGLFSYRDAAYTADSRTHFANRVELRSNFATQGISMTANGGDINFYTGGETPANERMRIAANGTVWLQGGAQVTSDGRLKKGIKPVENSLDKISHLNGVTYEWKNKSLLAGQHLGVIAQDVEKVFPEAVSTGPDGMKSVNYDALIAPMIEAIKEQQGMIEAQQGQIEDLKAKIQTLKSNL